MHGRHGVGLAGTRPRRQPPRRVRLAPLRERKEHLQRGLLDVAAKLPSACAVGAREVVMVGEAGLADEIVRLRRVHDAPRHRVLVDEAHAELGRARLEERARETDVSRRRAACAAVLERVNDALKEPRALLQEIDALREETADLAASEAAAAARGEPLPPSAAAAAANAKRRKDRVVAELRALTHGAAGAE